METQYMNLNKERNLILFKKEIIKIKKISEDKKEEDKSQEYHIKNMN